jgi:DNA repair protein RecN (Recombination protein N)
MLAELHIEQLGVIESLDLVLDAGLTALTGETGAGKTMLVEAIDLLVGGRADASMVRPGAAEARVEGRFVDGEAEVVLARVVPADGRSRAYVNGRLATVAQLAEHGARLVDLHGQHAHQSLLGAAAQRDALDAHAGIDLGPLRAARARVTEIDAALATLGGDSRARAREIDLLRFQVEEIDAAGLGDPEEERTLEREEDLLADAVAHREAVWRAVASLTDDGGATDAVGTAVAALGGRDALGAADARLRGVQAELDDIASELRALAESIEEDPERLAGVRERRGLLVDLRRKYGATLAEVIAYGADAARRLAELEGYEERAAGLDAERARAAEELAVREHEVGEARRAAAPGLARAVEAHLVQLAMPHARLEVAVGPGAGDEVGFLLAANPGSPCAPLAKVASGGELARTMLGLRLVLTRAPDTLVFDEVDAGIGGSAAVAVAAALARLGSRHQVLVVTHLPQVAAAATMQVAVEKRVTDGATFARAQALGDDARVQEVARMLSGGVAKDSAVRHARELLEASRSRRPSRA